MDRATEVGKVEEEEEEATREEEALSTKGDRIHLGEEVEETMDTMEVEEATAMEEAIAMEEATATVVETPEEEEVVVEETTRDPTRVMEIEALPRNGEVVTSPSSSGVSHTQQRRETLKISAGTLI